MCASTKKLQSKLHTPAFSTGFVCTTATFVHTLFRTLVYGESSKCNQKIRAYIPSSVPTLAKILSRHEPQIVLLMYIHTRRVPRQSLWLVRAGKYVVVGPDCY